MEQEFLDEEFPESRILCFSRFWVSSMEKQKDKFIFEIVHSL